MCDSYAIDQVRLETAIVDAIKSTLSEPTTERQVEASLRRPMASGNREPASDLRHFRERLLDIELRKSNLMSAIEAGAGGQSLHTLIHRLRDLEEEGKKISEEISELQSSDLPDKDLRDAGVAVADFILNFRERFQEMSPEDKKAQVKCCVSRIVIDKEAGIATAYIRKIPAVLPAIEELYRNQRAPTTVVVSALSSGDRT